MGSAATLGSSLALWHDYRAGHAAHQGGYSGGSFDGVANGAAGRFRTGFGFETSHDYASGAEQSLGYIRVPDNAAFFPPLDGCCVGASYIQSNAALECQIIGQGGTRFNDISWQLIRTATEIRFVTSDGVALSTFAYALPAVPGQVETVAVRYTGGTGPNNCTIYVLSPTPSSSTGTIDRVPQNVGQPVSVCCWSTTPDKPFMGTMRYALFIRGAQTAAILAAIAAEVEGTNWATDASKKDQSGSVSARAVQYISKFGIDASIADESGTSRTRLSNSDWHFGNAAGASGGSWRVAPVHTMNTGVGSPADIQKVLQNSIAGKLNLPARYFSQDSTPTNLAYGTWDFWVQYIGGNTQDTYFAHLAMDDGAGNMVDAGYLVRIDGDLSLCFVDVPGGVVVQPLISIPGVVPGTAFVHIRVTRTLLSVGGNVFKLYYALGVTGSWVYAGSTVDATFTTADGIFLNYRAGDALLLGNHRSDKALFKWRGVVDPL